MNVSKKFLHILLFGFIIVLGSFGNYHDTFAVADLSKSFDKNTTFVQDIFTKAETDNFNYLVITVSPDTDWTGSGSAYGVGVRFNNVTFQFSPHSPYLLIEKPNSPNATTGVSFVSYYSSSQWLSIIGDMTWTFTLTNDLPGTGTGCPQPDPCDDPEENSRFMQVVIDSFWKYHAAFAYVVPALIAIFIVYRIIKSRLR